MVNALAALASSSVISAGLNSGPDSVLAPRPLDGSHPHTPLHASSGISQMTLRPSPSMSHANDSGAAARWFRSGLQSSRPVSEAVSLDHESLLWESQRRISDNGLDMPQWGAEIFDSAWDRNAQLGHKDTVLHDPSENKSNPALSGYGIVNAHDVHIVKQHTDLSRKRHQSLLCASELGNMTAHVSDDDVDGIIDADAQLTQRTSMAMLRINELTEKASLIEKVSNVQIC